MARSKNKQSLDLTQAQLCWRPFGSKGQPEPGFWGDLWGRSAASCAVEIPDSHHPPPSWNPRGSEDRENTVPVTWRQQSAQELSGCL